MTLRLEIPKEVVPVNENQISGTQAVPSWCDRRNGVGEVVVTGTPEDVSACKASYTGRFLKARLRLSPISTTRLPQLQQTQPYLEYDRSFHRQRQP